MKKIIEKLKTRGIVFANGLTNKEFGDIEKLYKIKFPKQLKDFLSEAMPFSIHSNVPKIASFSNEKVPYYYEFPFPIWNDFTEENIVKIKKWIDTPKNSVLEEYNEGKNFKDKATLEQNGKKTEIEIPGNYSLLEAATIDRTGKTEQTIDKEFKNFVENKLEKTIPIYSHRYILQKENSPILSIAQSDDIVVYGENLIDYFEREFLEKKNSSEWGKIDFGCWDEIIMR